MTRPECTHNEDQVVLYFYDELDPATRAEVEVRLQVCPGCRAALDELSLVAQAVPMEPRPAPDAATMARMRAAAIARGSSPWWSAAPRRPRQGWAAALGLGGWQPAPLAMRLAFAVVLLALGFWWGQRGPAPTALTLAEGPDDATLGELLLAEQPIETEAGRIDPFFAGVDEVAYDAGTGLVEIRYQTLNAVVLHGQPDDPAVQRLLRQALLDEANPGARLGAARALDAFGGAAAPDSALVDAMVLLLGTEANQGIRLQVLDALRTLHQQRPYGEPVKQALLAVLLGDENSALRIAALQALTEGSLVEQNLTGYLETLRDDPNSFIRYQASTLLHQQEPGAPPALRLSPLPAQQP